MEKTVLFEKNLLNELVVYTNTWHVNLHQVHDHIIRSWNTFSDG